jgi:nucleoside diphosphate kinase
MKERQMEFDMESDPEVMYDLFGEDAACFAEGPVRVYVLERRGAVEIWQDLIGPADPELARQHKPNSLRALYGISVAQKCDYGLIG